MIPEVIFVGVSAFGPVAGKAGVIFMFMAEARYFAMIDQKSSSFGFWSFG